MPFFQYPDEDKGSKSESTRERKGDIGKERKRDEKRQYNQRKNQIDSRDGEVKEREKERKKGREDERDKEKERERRRAKEREREGRGLCAGWCKHVLAPASTCKNRQVYMT